MMYDRASKMLAFWAMLTPHARRLMTDEIRYALADRGYTPRAILNTPLSGIAAVMAYLEKEGEPCLDE